MKAVELINNDVPPIRPNESLSKALSWMEEFSVNHLPVVKGGLYVRIISDNIIYDHNQLGDKIDNLKGVNLEIPPEQFNFDLSCNIAMVLGKKKKENQKK